MAMRVLMVATATPQRRAGALRPSPSGYRFRSGRNFLQWTALLAALAALVPFTPAAAAADPPEPNAVLVVTASARDYLFGAGGTLAKMIEEGRPVYVLQFGSDEKDSIQLGPAAARLANNEEGERAARQLGVKEVLNLGHKSGELAYISSSEMRNQVMTMVRFYKPEILFFPDWYAHYLNDDDVYRVGRMAEEAPYGGGDYFVQEMTYIGYGGYAAREYYFYIPHRPYRPREGGEGQAQLRHVNIASTFDRKVQAILELKTSNSRYASQTRERLQLAGRPHELLREINDNSTAQLIRSYLEDLAQAVASKHGLRHAEEFNYLGRSTGLPAHIRERARPAAQSTP
jgi:LmbE family N-acetylglucosaminyl deacetylase